MKTPQKINFLLQVLDSDGNASEAAIRLARDALPRIGERFKIVDSSVVHDYRVSDVEHYVSFTDHERKKPCTEESHGLRVEVPIVYVKHIPSKQLPDILRGPEMFMDYHR